jgi:hypothetical protein
MKRLKFRLSVIGFLIAILFSLNACEKQNTIEFQNSTNSINKNLIERNSSDKEIITFEEVEGFALNRYYANLFGYSTIVINPGKYSIRYDNESNQFYSELSIKELGEKMETARLTGGIRIAKRICNAHSKACHCGVGFRCGFVMTYEEMSGFPDNTEIEGKVDEEKGVLVIIFKNISSPDYFFALEAGKNI